MKIEMNALRILMRENGQAFRDWVVVARVLKREGSGFSLTGDSIASRLLISGRFSRLRFCQTSASRPTRSPLQQSIRAPPTSSKENVTRIAKSWSSESPELRMDRSRGHVPNQLRSLQMPLEPLKSYKMPRWLSQPPPGPWFLNPVRAAG